MDSPTFCYKCGVTLVNGQCPACPAGPRKTLRFQFDGKGSALFVLYLKTFLLSVVTLGIYSFWGRTEIRRYLHNATMAGEDRFAWHGTPMELLKGWGKAVGLILGFYFVVVLLSALDPERGGPIGTVLLYVAVVAVAPWAIVASQRYRLSRTSLRGIHFHSTADAGEFAKLYFKGLLLTIITLSLYAPWFFNDLQSYLRRNSYYGDRPFSYDGKGGDLFRSYLIFIVLLIPSLYLISFWFFAKQTRYLNGHTTFGEARFQTSVRGRELLFVILGNALLTVITLGMGAAWANVNMARFWCEATTLENFGGFDVRQRTMAATATGESVASILEIDSDAGAFGI